MSEEQDTATQIRAEQLKELYARLPSAAGLSFTIATVLAVVQWPVVRPSLVAGWWGALGLVTAARLLLLARYRRAAPAPPAAGPWRRRFLAGTAGAGLVWGSAGFLLFPEGEIVHQVFLAFALAGTGAAGVTTLAPVLGAVLTFEYLMLVPLTGRLLVAGDPVHLLMGGMTFLFLVQMTVSARRTHGTILEVLTLRIDYQRQKDELRHGEERFRTLFTNTADAIFIHNLKGRFLEANEEACARLGYSREEFLEMTPMDIDTPEFAALVPQRIEQVQQKRSLVFEAAHVRRDGTVIPVEISSRLIEFEGQSCILSVCRDVTARKRWEQALVEAKRAAEESNRAKSQFLANMSHEIRTPLNAVVGLASLMEDSELTSEQREHVEMLKDSADSLLVLLSGLLELSRIEAGNLELERLDFDLRARLERLREALAGRAQRKGLKLEFLIAPEVPSALRGDPGRLGQILRNLVGNAIKFTPEGEVTVRVGVEQEDDAEARLRFTVTDTGIGIPAKEIPTLFDAFYQVDASSTRRYGGSGLGLSIAKQLCEIMGGRIGVESEPGKGSRFWFTVRLEKQPPDQEPAPKAAVTGPQTGSLPAAAEDQPKGRILVAEDHVVSQRVTRLILERMGYRAEVVATGREAVAAAARTAYDLILMDVQMPEMDGYEATRRIRQAADSERRVPIIAMTAHALKGDRDKCLAAGMDDYVSKPIQPADLAEVLARWMGSGSGPTRPATPA